LLLEVRKSTCEFNTARSGISMGVQGVLLEVWGPDKEFIIMLREISRWLVKSPPIKFKLSV